MRRLLATLVCAFAVITAPAHATPRRENVPLVQGPPPGPVVSPYDSALACLATQLTEEQRLTSFSVGNFPDRTGRVNYVSESGVGTFSSQGAEDMILTSLYRAGVQVVDITPFNRNTTDWVLGRVAMSGQPTRMSIMYPDVLISGAITTFDFLPGGGFSGNIAGIRLGHRQSRILVAMDARAVAMPGNRMEQPGGRIMAVDRPSKQIVGYEDGVGGSGFFGPRNSPTYVSLDFGRRPNEAIQFAQRYVLDRVVFTLVSQVHGITACNEQLAWGDGVANLQ